VAITKVFMSGNSQAVRIPKEFQFDTEELEIFHRDGEVILRKKPTNLSEAFEILTSMPSDFFSEGREDPPSQERDPI
jgi:antitoxin VapB